MGNIAEKYAQLGGSQGLLGTQISPVQPTYNGGQKQEFQNGTIYWHPQTGAFEVHGAIRSLYVQLNADQSFIGYPISDETTAQDGIGKFNNFEHGAIYWHPSAGAHEVHGLIRAYWISKGAEMSTLGYPLTSEMTVPDGVGRYNHFENGSIYWKPVTGAIEVYGAIRDRWAELRWERGILGYPVRSPFRDTRNRTQFLIADFEGGQIELNLNTQHVHVKKFATASSPNYSIPITAYRVSDTSGDRPCEITADGVRQWVDEANRVFAAAGVLFTYDGVLNELRDTEINNLTGESDPFWLSARDRLNQLASQNGSIVVVHRFGPETTSIGGGFSWWTYDFVAMSFFDPNALSVLPHELGHYLGLPHTHGRYFETAREAIDYVLGGGSIEELDGDRSLIDDTPGDPYIRELRTATSIDAITLGGRAFSLARNNIMSYWDHGATARLTHSQIDRVREVILERRGRNLNVTIVTPVDCNELTGQITALQVRLQEMIAQLATEQDPILRSTLAYAIALFPSKIMSLTVQARNNGCI